MKIVCSPAGWEGNQLYLPDFCVCIWTWTSYISKTFVSVSETELVQCILLSRPLFLFLYLNQFVTALSTYKSWGTFSVSEPTYQLVTEVSFKRIFSVSVPEPVWYSILRGIVSIVAQNFAILKMFQNQSWSVESWWFICPVILGIIHSWYLSR